RVRNLDAGASAVEAPGVKRTLDAISDDGAVHAEMGAKMRAVGIEDAYGAVFAAEADQLAAEVAHALDLAHGEFVGKRHDEPTGGESAQRHQAVSGVKCTGTCFQPLMKFERKRRTGPASDRSGRRRSSSSKITRISSRARLAPRQKCSPAPKARCSLGVRATSKRSGFANTSSSRFADE